MNERGERRDPIAYRRVSHLVGFVQEPRGVPFRVVDAVQLQDERAARAYPRAPREKVSADDSLEDGGLAAGLPADDDDLGQALPQGREILAARRVDAVAGERTRLLMGFRGWFWGAGRVSVGVGWVRVAEGAFATGPSRACDAPEAG